MTAKLYWMGSMPDTCNICNGDILGAGEFVDGATRRGLWAMMCLSCHELFGFGLGEGLGQQYTLGEKNRWWKTGG